MKEIVIAIILITIFILVLFIFLYLTTRRINVLLKKVYINKLQNFDYLIEDKENKIENLNSIIKEKQNELDNLLEKEKLIDIEEEPKVKDTNDIIIPKADFDDGNFASDYIKIKKCFNFSTEEKILEFIKKYVSDEKINVDKLRKIKSYFDHDIIFKLLNYNSKNQYLIVEKILNRDERNLVEDLLIEKNFNINSFVSNLEKKINKNNPKIYIYVNNDNENYSNLNSNIVMKKDLSIIEGFKIVYKDVVYDYSI